MNNKIIISEELQGQRLDKALSLICKDYSRSHLTLMVELGSVLVNDKIEKPSYKVKLGDIILINEMESKEDDSIDAEDIPLDIVYEDNDIIVINKAQGMVVHPAVGHHEHTLVNALLHHCKDLSGINGKIRPGIVHRIDKDTSGLIVAAKNDYAHEFLAEQLKDHTMNREYIALVKGVIQENEGKIDLPIARSKQNRQKMCVEAVNGKRAVTYFTVLERFYDYTLVKCRLETGRTHQIRVHMSYISHPIEGDKIYSKSKSRLYDEGQLLHAYRLNLIHPSTKKKMSFECDIPDYFKKVIENLKKR